MAFDPDAFLKSSPTTPTKNVGFDPDAFLRDIAAQKVGVASATPTKNVGFDPDAFLRDVAVHKAKTSKDLVADAFQAQSEGKDISHYVEEYQKRSKEGSTLGAIGDTIKNTVKNAYNNPKQTAEAIGSGVKGIALGTAEVPFTIGKSIAELTASRLAKIAPNDDSLPSNIVQSLASGTNRQQLGAASELASTKTADLISRILSGTKKIGEGLTDAVGITHTETPDEVDSELKSNFLGRVSQMGKESQIKSGMGALNQFASDNLTPLSKSEQESVDRMSEVMRPEMYIPMTKTAGVLGKSAVGAIPAATNVGKGIAQAAGQAVEGAALRTVGKLEKPIEIVGKIITDPTVQTIATVAEMANNPEDAVKTMLLGGAAAASLHHYGRKLNKTSGALRKAGERGAAIASGEVPSTLGKIAEATVNPVTVGATAGALAATPIIADSDLPEDKAQALMTGVGAGSLAGLISKYTKGGKTLPESKATIDEQMGMLNAGTKDVVMAPKGTPAPKVPDGMQSLSRDGNTFIYDPKKIKAPTIIKAYREDKLGDVLGYGISEKPTNPAGTVVVESPTGVEKSAVVTDLKNAGNVVDAAKKIATPGDIITAKAPQDVLVKRLDDTRAEIVNGLKSLGASEADIKSLMMDPNVLKPNTLEWADTPHAKALREAISERAPKAPVTQDYNQIMQDIESKSIAPKAPEVPEVPKVAVPKYNQEDLKFALKNLKMPNDLIKEILADPKVGSAASIEEAVKASMGKYVELKRLAAVTPNTPKTGVKPPSNVENLQKPDLDPQKTGVKDIQFEDMPTTKAGLSLTDYNKAKARLSKMYHDEEAIDRILPTIQAENVADAVKQYITKYNANARKLTYTPENADAGARI